MENTSNKSRISKKIVLGQFFTKGNPFNNHVFKSWFKDALNKSKNSTILEPFCGQGDIINLLPPKLCKTWKGFDIDKGISNVVHQDTLKEYPAGFDIVITNPPYLAKNSARRKGLSWFYTDFDDLYKVAINEMLKNCLYIAAIVPASLLASGLFRERLSDYILLNFSMFDDTEMPVCLALFKPQLTTDINIWELDSNNNIEFKSTYNNVVDNLDNILFQKNNAIIKFNDINGEFGIRATDKSFRSIEFVNGNMIPNSKVKSSSRNLVRFSTNDYIKVQALRDKLEDFFNANGELLLTPFKGLRNDGKYRRRLDFNTIRRLVRSCQIK